MYVTGKQRAKLWPCRFASPGVTPLCKLPTVAAGGRKAGPGSRRYSGKTWPCVCERLLPRCLLAARAQLGPPLPFSALPPWARHNRPGVGGQVRAHAGWCRCPGQVAPATSTGCSRGVHPKADATTERGCGRCRAAMLGHLKPAPQLIIWCPTQHASHTCAPKALSARTAAAVWPSQSRAVQDEASA